LENDSGEIATRMNITNKTGMAAIAVQIVMQVATKTRALRKKMFHQMDSRPGLSAIVADLIDRCRWIVCTSTRVCAVNRVHMSGHMLATTGFEIDYDKLQGGCDASRNKIVKAHVDHDDTQQSYGRLDESHMTE
jgi:hypothetical protein